MNIIKHNVKLHVNIVQVACTHKCKLRMRKMRGSKWWRRSNRKEEEEKEEEGEEGGKRRMRRRRGRRVWHTNSNTDMLCPLCTCGSRWCV